jgi:hypothetical protein
MREFDERGTEPELRPLSASELDAVTGGVGGWAFAAHAPQVLPPSPCFVPRALMVPGHAG